MTGWHTEVPDDHPAAHLLSASAVRRHCQALMDQAEAGDSEYFRWQPDRLAPTADYVAETIRQRYPDLAVPYHSRWRHFDVAGVDHWAELMAIHELTGHEATRAMIDLVIPSVLLDAGAGPDWVYKDPISHKSLSRSEGLGVASFYMFAEGLMSDRLDFPLRTDATALLTLDARILGDVFQVSTDNPLVGLAGRAALLRRLGEVAAATPAVFGTPARLGNLLDYLLAHADQGRIAAEFVLSTLLRALGPVWPGRTQRGGVSLGDCWPHPRAPEGLVPFHKLTQWLTYSLLEPLEAAGLTVTGLDALTGLPEYRNGGLLLDMGLLVPIDAGFLTRPLTVDEPAVVEWRALTVIALDRLAEAVRLALGMTAADFPLARVLEGGTWAAGRRIAAERRPGGGPPVNIISDGTVF